MKPEFIKEFIKRLIRLFMMGLLRINLGLFRMELIRINLGLFRMRLLKIIWCFLKFKKIYNDQCPIVILYTLKNEEIFKRFFY